jgi:hypothetical protein
MALSSRLGAKATARLWLGEAKARAVLLVVVLDLVLVQQELVKALMMMEEEKESLFLRLEHQKHLLSFYLLIKHTLFSSKVLL